MLAEPFAYSEHIVILYWDYDVQENHSEDGEFSANGILEAKQITPAIWCSKRGILSAFPTGHYITK